MTHIFYSTWEKPVCCVSKISFDSGCQSNEIGVGMEVRLLSVGTRGLFCSPLRDSSSRLRPQREKKTSGTRIDRFRHIFVFSEHRCNLLNRKKFTKNLLAQAYYSLNLSQSVPQVCCLQIAC